MDFIEAALEQDSVLILAIEGHLGQEDQGLVLADRMVQVAIQGLLMGMVNAPLGGLVNRRIIPIAPKQDLKHKLLNEPLDGKPASNATYVSLVAFDVPVLKIKE